MRRLLATTKRSRRANSFRLIPNPAPVYLTGDLGRLEPDGCLIHLGRMDFQVKIRGHRVELAEVEHVLTGAPGIADSAAWVVKNRLGEDQLVAYVVLKGGSSLDQQALEAFLDSRLPYYMVPRHYVVLDRLPSLPTGKTDRNGLPNPFNESTQRISTPISDRSERRTGDNQLVRRTAQGGGHSLRYKFSGFGWRFSPQCCITGAFSTVFRSHDCDGSVP